MPKPVHVHLGIIGTHYRRHLVAACRYKKPSGDEVTLTEDVRKVTCSRCRASGFFFILSKVGK